MAQKPMCSRAKIFQPFDALPGFREALQLKEWEHESCPMPDLVEGARDEMDRVLQELQPGQVVRIRYHEDGHYHDVVSAFRKVDAIYRRILLEEQSVSLDAIVQLQLDEPSP